MANIKSKKKRVITNEKSRVRNQQVKSRVKTFVKKALAAIEAKDKSVAEPAVKAAVAEIDRAVKKGTFHPNNGARKKASLQRRANTL